MSNRKGNANPLDNCENLVELSAPGFIQEFHSNAVGSISAMAGAFSGLATALQTQNNRAEEIEHRLVETNDQMRVFGEKMAETESVITDLATRIEEQLSNINERFEQHSEEFEQKLDSCNQELRGVIEDTSKQVMMEMKKDCKKMINKVASSVKNTENQIKTLNKICQENRDKIEVNKTKMEETKQTMLKEQEQMRNTIAELNTYVEKTTADLKETVEYTAKKLTDQMADVDKRLQEFRFKTENDLAHKADLEDLKRKMDVSEFMEFAQQHKEALVEQEETNESLNEKITEEAKNRQKHADEVVADFATAEDDRRKIHEQLEYLQSRLGDQGPDPTVAIENLHRQLMDHISEVEAILREEMKARLASQAPPAPSFGSSDGTCFSCGRGGGPTPASGAFPAMPVRSPSNKASVGGGFRTPKSKKLRTSKSLADASNKLNRTASPKRMQQSRSLPELREGENMPPRDSSMGNSDPIKLPEVVRPPSASGNVNGYVGVQHGSPSPTSSARNNKKPIAKESSSSASSEKVVLPPALTTEV